MSSCLLYEAGAGVGCWRWSWGRTEPGGAAEGSPARVGAVCTHRGQLATGSADGGSQVAGGHGAETEDPTRRADTGATTYNHSTHTTS